MRSARIILALTAVAVLTFGSAAAQKQVVETVLRHEIAHVLIARAAHHREVPRWFNEGLAIHAAREWGFEDRARVTVATVKRDGVALAELERRFQGGAHSAASAYASGRVITRAKRPGSARRTPTSDASNRSSNVAIAGNALGAPSKFVLIFA